MVPSDSMDLSTNWTVLRGSLADVVSFESSSDDSPTAISGGLILTRPSSDDPPPCEVTVCFRKTHEIYSVYVRSTARIYEIYCSYDQVTCGKEYLCTVPCAASLNEVELPSTTCAYTRQSNACNDGNSLLSAQTCKDDSACCDPDDWVEVKYPVSVLDKEADFLSSISSDEVNTNFQILHEATAEISDLGPLVSITFRLLSIQTKSCVCIEEIYVYADPVESIISEPTVGLGNSLAGNNALLCMLAPRLLELSKSGNRRDNSSGKCSYSHNVERFITVLETESPHVERLHSEDEPEMRPVFEATQAAPEDLCSKCPLSGSDHGEKPKSNQQEDNQTCLFAENMLNDLVSRIGRIEAFCSRFEECMVKPISCIERKLLQLEEKLDVFTARFQLSEPIHSLNISSPEYLCGESDSQDNNYKHPQVTDEGDTSGDLSRATTSVGPKILQSLVTYAPEFSSAESYWSSHLSFSALSPQIPEPTPEASFGDSLLPNATSVLDHDISQSAIIGDPEFFVEDDECISTDDSSSVNDPGDKPSSLSYSSLLSNSGDAFHLAPKELNKTDADSSLDSALALNLAALMPSMTVKSPASSTLPINLNEEPNNISLYFDGALASVITGDPSEYNGIALGDSVFEIGDCAASLSSNTFLKEQFSSFSPSDNGALASTSIHGTPFCTEKAICDSAFGASRSATCLKGSNCLSQSDNGIYASSEHSENSSGDYDLWNSCRGMLDRIQKAVGLADSSLFDGDSCLLDGAKCFPLSTPSKCATVTDPESLSDSCDFINCDNNSLSEEVKSNTSHPGLIDYLRSRSSGDMSLNDYSKAIQNKLASFGQFRWEKDVGKDKESGTRVQMEHDYFDLPFDSTVILKKARTMPHEGELVYQGNKCLKQTKQHFATGQKNEAEIITQNTFCCSLIQDPSHTAGCTADNGDKPTADTLCTVGHDCNRWPGPIVLGSLVHDNFIGCNPPIDYPDISSSGARRGDLMLNRFEGQVAPIGSVDKNNSYMGAGDISLGKTDAEHNWGVDNKICGHDLVKSALEYDERWYL